MRRLQPLLGALVAAVLAVTTVAPAAARAQTAAPESPTEGVVSGVHTVTVSEPGEPDPLVVAPLSGHYHSGGTISLVATDTTGSDHDTYEWLVQRPDQDTPTTLDATGPETTLRAEQALHGAQVWVRLLDDDGNAVATAEPRTIDVDDHGAPPTETLTISGLADHYHSGATITLTAEEDPESILDTYRWTIQHGDDDPVTADTTGPTLTLTADADLDGATVTAELVFDDGTTYVAADPVTITVDDHEPEPGCETPDPRPTVVLGGVDTGLPNRVAADGCSINDLIDDEGEWAHRGAFLRHVTEVARGLADEDLLSARERAALVRAGRDVVPAGRR